MQRPDHALAAAAQSPPRPGAAGRRVLVIGGGGRLGSQVLKRLLGGARFQAVGVLVAMPVQPALRGLRPLPDDDAAWQALAPDTALLVFDRARHANGRDDAFVQPQPGDLAAWAERLRRHHVRTLLVVVPHAPGLLPQALKAGLASMDEGRVAALGFEHLVFMRSAQTADRDGGRLRTAPARLAQWMLTQLHWMVPQQEQPVRAATVARVAARIAAVLPDAAPGTRVLAAEWLWAVAQAPDRAGGDAVVDAWIAGLPLAAAPQRRLWTRAR